MLKKLYSFFFVLFCFTETLAQDFDFELSDEELYPGIYELNITARPGVSQSNIGFQSSYNWEWKVKFELGSDRWIFEADENTLNEKEKFVKKMVIAHQNRTSINDLIDFLDDGYFQTKLENYKDHDFFTREQKLFQEIVDVRILGIIKYGNFDLVLPQIRYSDQPKRATSSGLMNLVRIEGNYRLSTSTKYESVWINLNFGPLRDQLDKYLEQLIGVQ